MSEIAMLRQPSNSFCRMMKTTMHGTTHSTVRPYGRLKLVGAGLVLAFVGSILMARGIQVVRHWTGQPMFSWGFLAGGGLCILFALIPTSWIAKAASTRSKPHRRGQ